MSRKAPEGWRNIRLGDVARETRSRNVSLQISQERLVGVFKSEGMIPTRDRVRGESVERCKIVRPGAFAYNPMRLNIGSIARWHGLEEAIVSPDYVVFEPDPVHLDGAFLDHLRTSTPWQKFTARAGDGGVRIRIYFDDLAEFRFALPPLGEQRRIAEILSSVDEAIQATQVVIEQTGKVRLLLLNDLFHRGHWDEGRALPSNSKLVLLDDVAKRGSGHTPSKSHPEYWNGGVKWVSLQDTKRLDDVFISETTAEISDLGIANSSAVLHPAGTVVISRDATVGRSAILASPMAVSQHFIAWTCSPKLNNVFLYYWLQHMKPVFERIGAGSTIKTIGLPFFKSLAIPLPPLKLQESLGTRMMEVDQAIRANKAELDRLMVLKTSLLSDLLTGRKRVSDDLLMAAE